MREPFNLKLNPVALYLAAGSATLVFACSDISVEGLPPELRGGISDVGADDLALDVGGADSADAGALADSESADPFEAFGVWEPWARVLAAHHGPGCFDYDGLIASDEALAYLAETIAIFAETDVAEFQSNEEHLAFWYNAYNAFIVQAIVDGYDTYQDTTILLPVGGELAFRAERWEASGRTLSLNMIEHAILRRDLERALVDDETLGRDLLSLADLAHGDEPFDVRLHFALNCASVGCPDLRAEPYLAEVLDAQLEEQTSGFLNDPAKGAGPLGISELLTGLYPEDFARDFGSVEAYVLRYNPTADTGQRIAYDWSLNECE